MISKFTSPVIQKDDFNPSNSNNGPCKANSKDGSLILLFKIIFANLKFFLSIAPLTVIPK